MKLSIINNYLKIKQLKKYYFAIINLFFLKKIKLGIKNPDIVFYLIRSENPAGGIFSNHNIFLKQIRFAISKNYIPVIDMQFEENCIYHEKDQAGVINTWDLYFSQPFGYTVNEVMQSKNVIISSNRVLNLYNHQLNSLSKEKELKTWSFLSNKYLKFNRKTQEYLDDIYKTVIPNNRKVLGVSIRDGYSKSRPKWHPIQPGIDVLIKKVKQEIAEFKYEHVFLSVETQDIIDEFEKEFQRKLIVVDRPRIGNDLIKTKNNNGLNVELYESGQSGSIEQGKLKDLSLLMDTTVFDRPNDKYLKGLEYISEMYILSKCDSLVCGETSGTIAVLIRNNNNFNNYYFFNLGLY